MQDKLVAFIAARLDELEVKAKGTLDAVPGWPEEVWVTPGSDGVQPSVSVSEHAPKAYARLWHDEVGATFLEHGWVVHDTSVCVWSEAEAKRALREVTAMRAHLAMYAEYAAAQYPDYDGGYASAMEDVLKHDAAVWDDHPDYCPDWAPGR